MNVPSAGEGQRRSSRTSPTFDYSHDGMRAFELEETPGFSEQGAASDVPKATMIAKLKSVIMPGLWSASSRNARRMKTRPP